MSPKAVNKDDRRIGGKIRQLRRARDMSQTQLAAAIGVTFQQLQKYEKGKNRISASRLQAVARVLGVPATVLLGEAHTTEPMSADTLRLTRAFEAIADARLRAQAIHVVETLAVVGE